MDTVKFINLKPKQGKTGIEPDRILLHWYNKNNSNIKSKGCTYDITLNQELSKEIQKKGLKYMRIAENTIVWELYFVFIKEETPDAIQIRQHGKGAKSIRIYSKQLVNYLIKRFQISEEEARAYPLRVSENTSKNDETIVIVVSKF